MNILFFYTETIDPLNGGVERVTYVLSEYFIKKGHNVYLLGFHENSVSLKHQSYLPDSNHLNSKNNIKFLNNFIIENKINIIINQGALLEESVSFINSVKNKDVKIFSVIHNSLLSTINNIHIVYESILKQKHLGYLVNIIKISFFKKLIRYVYILKKRRHYKNLLENDGKLVLLSDTYFSELSTIIGEFNQNKVVAIPNPTSKVNPSLVKSKIVLYVGRINRSQKNLDLLLQIWAKIWKDIEDWSLVIVGDGEDVDKLKNYAKELSLQNIHFEGKRDPMPYYDKAPIFCMTSAFEGFPMTLIEAMSFGDVPILFNSFSSAPRIINNEINGFLIPPFDTNKYANKLKDLIINESLINQMSEQILDSIKIYDIERIGNQWLDLFYE